MLCTIVTDASFCPQTKFGGWAAWIVCDQQRQRYCAAFKDPCLSGFEAERNGAINGLYLAKRHFPDAYRYHFVVDCRGVIDVITQKKGDWWPKLKVIADPIPISVKHVKAHTRDTAARSWVNRWCDTYAKQAMKELRGW